MVAYASYKNI
ncbi:Protein of unknown function [Bacillus wiedmannii]|nr:Protein of unknown function [Bacillus wiedmannii]